MSKSYKNLSSYIESTDPDLYNIIKTLCLDTTLLSSKHKDGITFIHPRNEEYRALMMSLSESTEENELDILTKMISSIFIRGCYRTPMDIMTKRDNIINMLNQRIEIEGARDKYIYTKSGANLSVSNDFIDGSKKNKFAVWQFTAGKIDINGPEVKIGMKGDDEKLKENNEMMSLKESIYLRYQIIKSIEEAYMREINSKFSRSRTPRDIYVDAILNFLDYMMSNEYCKEVLFNRVIPMITFTKPDLYILIEPYKFTNAKLKSDGVYNYLIDDKILTDWYRIYDRNVNLAKTYAKFNELLDKSYIAQNINEKTRAGNSNNVNNVNNVNNSNNSNNSSQTADRANNQLIYANSQGMLTQINESRMRLLSKQIAPQLFISEVSKQYEVLFTYNILPPDLVKFYGSPIAKMYEDDFRYILSMKFREFETTQGSFPDIVQYISDYTCGDSIDPLLLRKINKNGLPPTEKINEIRTFINSTFFFGVPLSDETLKNFPHKYVVAKPDSNKPALYNYEEFCRARVRAYIDKFTKDVKTAPLSQSVNAANSDNSSSSDRANDIGDMDDERIRKLITKLKRENKLDSYLTDN